MATNYYLTVSGTFRVDGATIALGNAVSTPTIVIGNTTSGSTTIQGNVIIGTDTTGSSRRIYGTTIFTFTFGTTNVDFESRPRFFNGMLFYNDNTTRYFQFYMETTGTYCIYNQDGTGVFLGYGSTGWAANSDRRIKNTIHNLPDGLNIINQLRPVSFYFNGNEKKTFGFIAQEMEEVIPEIVSTGGYNETIQDNVKGIETTNIIPFLVKSIQEQDTKITNLEKDLKQLKELLMAKL